MQRIPDGVRFQDAISPEYCIVWRQGPGENEVRVSPETPPDGLTRRSSANSLYQEQSYADLGAFAGQHDRRRDALVARAYEPVARLRDKLQSDRLEVDHVKQKLVTFLCCLEEPTPARDGGDFSAWQAQFFPNKDRATQQLRVMRILENELARTEYHLKVEEAQFVEVFKRLLEQVPENALSPKIQATGTISPANDDSISVDSALQSYRDAVGDIIVREDGIVECEADHRQQIRQRSYRRDRGDNLSVSSAEIDRLHEHELKELSLQCEDAKTRAAVAHDKCVDRGIEPESENRRDAQIFAVSDEPTGDRARGNKNGAQPSYLGSPLFEDNIHTDTKRSIFGPTDSVQRWVDSVSSLPQECDGDLPAGRVAGSCSSPLRDFTTAEDPT